MTYMYLGKYYLEHLTVILSDRQCNFLEFDPTFKRFHQDLTEIWLTKSTVYWFAVSRQFVVCSYNLSGLLTK
jgi:hypothetical protein